MAAGELNNIFDITETIQYSSDEVEDRRWRGTEQGGEGEVGGDGVTVERLEQHDVCAMPV